MTAKEWEVRVKRCQASGKTAKAWCEANEIPYHSYLRWAKRFRRGIAGTEEKQQGKSRQWVSVLSPIKEGNDKGKESAENMMSRKPTSGRLTIIVGEGLQEAQMAELLRAVREVCC